MKCYGLRLCDLRRRRFSRARYVENTKSRRFNEREMEGNGRTHLASCDSSRKRTLRGKANRPLDDGGVTKTSAYVGEGLRSALQMG
jgi:hypothetical protein